MTTNRNVHFGVAFFLGALAVTLTGCTKADLSSKKSKYSYAIGVQIGKNLKQQNIDLDPKAFAAGVEDMYAGEKPRLSDDERMAALREMTQGLQMKQAAKAQENEKTGEAFLAQNKSKPGWKVTSSGLQYHMVRDGSGKQPTANDNVEVNYEGKLINGKVFDSSYERHQPATFPVNAVIPGWREALQLMKPGSKYELAIPPQLAYGPQGSSVIPGNSVLLFTVELLKVLPGSGASAQAGHHAKKHKHK